jgi:hypothetical protein
VCAFGCVRVRVNAMSVCVCIALCVCASVCVVNGIVFVRARFCSFVCVLICLFVPL